MTADDALTRAALRSSAEGRALESLGNPSALPVVRIVVASTFNVEPIAPLLRAAFEKAGFCAEASVTPFGQVSEALLDSEPGPGLLASDLAVIVVACEDDLSHLFRRPVGLTAQSEQELINSRLDLLSRCVSAMAARVRTVIVVVVSPDRGPAVTGLRPAARRRRRDVVDRYVSGVLALDALAPNVVTTEWTHEVLATGGIPTRDPRLWYLARMRLDFGGLALLAEMVARHGCAVLRPARKVLAVDLDDTLWGGVLEEVGRDNLELGDEGIGLAFADLQRELLKLHDVGVALVLCSKNDRDVALDAISNHEEMVLSLENFAAVRIGWRDKSAMLQELATELGFGLDSFVFLDNSRVERDWVRRTLPDVLVPELPRDPALRVAFVASLGAFDRMHLTEEDFQRERSRAASGERQLQARSAADYEEFLATLGQEIDIAPLSESTAPRAAQLTERVNQFTLGRRLYQAAELAALARNPDVEICTARVRDRFDDSGITGLTIVRHAQGAAELDTFLLSCRVLGRRIEDGLLAFVARRAAGRGAAELRVRYASTARNGAVREFLLRRGLVEQATQSTGVSMFSIRLDEALLAADWPCHLTLRGEFAL